ncbi:DUF4489 domain-containing protein [Wukongibacter baidiensis]|uniref:DUF4489 domain-containing protein n=1 Tax=Wukongibacter baidiensis TaxID=1723361 RepID=UPI003D7F6A68
MSSYIKKACDCTKDIDCHERKTNDSLIKPTLLFCGQGGKGIFVGPDNPRAIVGRVLVDARDICKPTVSIEFSSIISFLATDEDAEGRLKFSLIRVCNNKSRELLNNWTYEVFRIEDFLDGMRFTDSFSFNYCDSLPCPECCEYFVEVSVENLLTANIVVKNVHITAVV